MPHPPVMIAAVGRGRENEAALTLAGAARIQSRLGLLPRGGQPDLLLVLSPHQPYAPGVFFLNDAGQMSGGLEGFGAPQVHFELKSPSAARRDLRAHLKRRGLPLISTPVARLGPDHGTLVPLHFLAEIFENQPPVILANPVGLSPAEALELGRALADFKPAGRWALLASGDLSHRLRLEGPGGFHPSGEKFDRELVAAVADGQVNSLLENWPARRLQEAGECGFRSALTMLGLMSGLGHDHGAELLSYEGPFGVGYANAFKLLGDPEL
jgi:aromatic ring-opening dioxygenase LigB subunit